MRFLRRIRYANSPLSDSLFLSGLDKHAWSGILMMIGQLADGIATALVGIISDRTGKVSLFAISELPYSFYLAPHNIFNVHIATHVII